MMFNPVGFMYIYSSGSSTDEEAINLRVSKRRLRDKFNPLDIPDTEFLINFRVNKEVFGHILNEISPHMKASFRNTAVPAAVKLAAFLRFLASGSYQNCIGNEFISCLSQTKVSDVVAECVQLFEVHFCSKWIKLPLSESDENEAKQHFYAKFQLPGVIGCVDGTHIKIMCPNEGIRHLYYNRKGYYSINAMVICDHNLVIKFVDARHPGANHDAFVWKASQAEAHYKELYTTGKRNFWLLGDAGYQCLPYLMTPFRNPAIRSEILFNERMCKARNAVERCFGVLKNRFRCIIGERGLHYSPEKATAFINVCCAVHNACIFYKNEWSAIEDAPTETLDCEFVEPTAGEMSAAAMEVRREIANSLVH